MYIRISVNNKIATLQDNVLIVNGNSDYVIKFDFDAEWDAYETKTARFMTARGYTDVVFSGDEVALPVIQNGRYIRIGVHAGDLRTTTPAVIFCRRCITDGSGSPADPTPDVYAQLMALLNDRIGIWYPTVDDAGNMSWEKSDTEEAPAPINIKGPIGETGAQGPAGATGATGAAGKTAYQYAQESGYTGTEEEFAEKLAQKQLDGTTVTLTPTQVYDAVSVGIPVKVQYFDGTYGALSFTAFNIAESLYTIVSQTIVYYDSTYILAELAGNLNGGWTFKSTMLAELTGLDSLDVRVSKLEGAGYLTLATLPKYGGESE